LAVLFGVLTRIGAACIAIVMLEAIFTVHLPQRGHRVRPDPIPGCHCLIVDGPRSILVIKLGQEISKDLESFV
jgi:uncharacterized membrane protein YphA (DoxX/SURF4 family)